MNLIKAHSAHSKWGFFNDIPKFVQYDTYEVQLLNNKKKIYILITFPFNISPLQVHTAAIRLTALIKAMQMVLFF